MRASQKKKQNSNVGLFDSVKDSRHPGPEGPEWVIWSEHVRYGVRPLELQTIKNNNDGFVLRTIGI